MPGSARSAGGRFSRPSSTGARPGPLEIQGSTHSGRVNAKNAPSFSLLSAQIVPPVPMDDALHERQPDARPLEIRRPMQPLERTEKLVRVLHVEPRAVVPDVIRRELRPGHVAADLDPRARLLTREFPGRCR